MKADSNIPRKANRILNLILLAFFLILIRVWYLSFVQQEYHQQQARKPKRKSIVQKVERATIRDRFNIPLSQNKIAYNASVRYADLREIPAHKWEKDEKGKKVKKPIRGPYISALAELLAKELKMDPQSIEDTIYAKASLFPHTPFILKENLTEEEYYRIRMLQKDWRGIEAERVSRREYPQHKVACDVVGYMGAISDREYLAIAEEIKMLQEYIKKRELGEIAFLPPGYKDPFEVRSRLKILQERAYTINDQIGKAGIEGFFDEILRGVHGKSIYEIDPKGNVLRELPGSKKPLSGQRVFLAISSELQQYAEELLAEHEYFRDVRDKNGELMPGTPWIKGGAAIALNPKTGEILALASYPRFDPNDFIPSQSPEIKKQKNKALCKWLENERYVGDIWDGKEVLSREIYHQSQGKWAEETQELNWDYFLSTILPPASSVRRAIDRIGSVKNAYLIQKHFEMIRIETQTDDPSVLMHVLYSQEGHIPGKKKISSEVLRFAENNLSASMQTLQSSIYFLNGFLSDVKHNDDKLLVLDLVRLLVCIENWDDQLVEKLGHLSLSQFLKMTQLFKNFHDAVKEKTQALHHTIGFKQWREKYFKEFLKQKRKEEKASKKPAKPYTEYLEKIEKKLFKTFWDACRFIFLDTALYQDQRISVEAHPQLQPYLNEFVKMKDSSIDLLRHVLKDLSPEEALQSMKCMRSFEEMTRPLYGKYRMLRNSKGVQLEKHLAAAFYPISGFSYVRSQAFRQSTPQGSVYKLAVAYEALKERYEQLKNTHFTLKDLNPLTIVDQIQMNVFPGSLKQLLGYTQEGDPIRRLYKGGVLPRTHPNIGKIDTVGAIEQSSNIYFSLLAAEHIADPSLLEKSTRELGLGSRTGIDLPGEISGSLPDDLSDNKTGLYSFAIGQHSLIVTPLQTAVMYAAFSNHGHVLKPQILTLLSGKKTSEDPFSEGPKTTFPFQDSLAYAGIDFPLFTEALSPSYNPTIHKIAPEIKRSLFFPNEIRTILLQGLHRVMVGAKGTARSSSIRYLRSFPQAAKQYEELKGQLVGKTGTAEIFYKQWLDSESKAEIRNHIWFAGIVFPEKMQGTEENWSEGELVVVVYLRFSQAGGKEAAPIGAQIACKWREIQKKYGASSYLETLALPDKDSNKEDL